MLPFFAVVAVSQRRFPIESAAPPNRTASRDAGLPTHLTSGKRDRKGISFNHVAITIAAASARLDYLLEDLDEDDGDPQARAVVGAVKAAFIA